METIVTTGILVGIGGLLLFFYGGNFLARRLPQPWGDRLSFNVRHYGRGSAIALILLLSLIAVMESNIRRYPPKGFALTITTQHFWFLSPASSLLRR